jgi:hypothetical protein
MPKDCGLIRDKAQPLNEGNKSKIRLEFRNEGVTVRAGEIARLIGWNGVFDS